MIVQRLMVMAGIEGNALTDIWKRSPFTDWIKRTQLIIEDKFLTFTKYSGKMKYQYHIFSFEAQVGLVSTYKGLKYKAFLGNL